MNIFTRTAAKDVIQGEQVEFDYEHQAWLVNGRYRRCGHPETTDCGCYGRRHQGRTPAEAILRNAVTYLEPFGLGPDLEYQRARQILQARIEEFIRPTVVA